MKAAKFFGQLFLSSLALLALAKPTLGAVSVNLSGKSETSNAALEKMQNNELSANISLGLGEHFLIGLTHRRSFDNKTGLKRQVNAEKTAYEYIAFEDNMETKTDSLDLTIIPFNGKISPLVFAGGARREYSGRLDYLGNRILSRNILPLIPNYGFGVMFQLGGGMQLKLTQTYSPGIETTLEDGIEKSRMVKDFYTQLWLGYRL